MNVDSKSGRRDYNDGDPTMAATRLYHRRLLDLTSSSLTEVSWNCAQHALDQMWTANDKACADECRPIHGCQTCGHLLHPGWQGTSLRVERSDTTKSNTLRRRRQRQRKKLAIFKQKNAKDVNRGRHQKAKEESSSTKEPRILLLRDDPNLILERHHLAIRCGRCHSKVRLNGLKQDKQKTQTDMLAVGANQKRKAEQLSPPKPRQAKPHAEDTNDFVQLPPATKKPNPLLSQQGRKKKKKKPEPKDKLMSFLNSLND